MSAAIKGGEMGERIRAFDWAATSLGPIESWPQSLKTSISLILNAQMPMWLGWGPDMVFFYNDAYIQVLSHAKHPWALGRPAREVWSEIWDICGPLADRVFRAGQAPFMEDVQLFMDRGGGFFEEVYYSFSYSPIEVEDGSVGGLFCPNTEVTAKILNARRLRTLSELAAKVLAERTLVTAASTAATTIAKNSDDIPFALIYLAADGGSRARLAQAIGIPAEHDQLSPRDVHLDGRADGSPWPISKVFTDGQVAMVSVPESEVVPRGLAGQRVCEAIALPISTPGHHRPLGVLVAGVNPTRRLDLEYTTFYELVARQVGTALQNALAAEEDRRRADALAELDRVKTAFFSNISHEFRTPLTLMIGPTEDALASSTRSLYGNSLETVYRNELRLLKLVNALLDFSRIEAGRMQVSFEAVDLTAFTADVASAFRSAIEKAGLRFEVDTPPLPREVLVDREMWEKIVLNLLSNALKFTPQGHIRLALEIAGDHVALIVEDTGTGIPEHELPRLFERFHRVENPAARTHEGSGIGLALVQELAKLHGGSVQVASTVGRGSRFVVQIPMRSANDPLAMQPKRDARPGVARTVFVAEAQRLTPVIPTSAEPVGPHILLADDNTDMRDYVRRLLEEHWRVVSVSDGDAALASARHYRPDLVLSDIMMPGLDGYGLLREIRSDAALRDIPVILLSARAGDEARVDGLSAGADDYLVKPFSARELIARVRTHLALSEARRSATRHVEQLYALLMQVPAVITVRQGPELRVVFQNTAALKVNDERGTTLREMWPAAPNDWIERFQRVMSTGETIVEREVAAERTWGGGEQATRYWDVTYAPVVLNGSSIDGVMTIGVEVTDRVLAQTQVEAARQRLDAARAAADIGTYLWNIKTNEVQHDAGVRRLFGYPPEGDVFETFAARVHEQDRVAWREAVARSFRDGSDLLLEYRVTLPDGTLRWLLDKGQIIRDDHGEYAYIVGAIVDITEQRRLAEAALAASRAKDEFLAMLGHELRNPLAPIMTALELVKLRGTELPKEYAVIERQVNHLARLVDDLLDISRITRGLIELKRERIAIRDAISKAVEMASPLIEQRRHHVTVEVPAGLIVDADVTRLAQVFCNLLTNAARYTPENGRIRIEAAAVDDFIRVGVSDTGIGIDATMITRIFDLFEQGANRDASRGEGGLGIGLALVRSLVKLHGGSVSATSEGPGCGSTFEVLLPAATRAGDDASLVGRSGPVAKRDAGRRILVVDDNEDAAFMLSEMLQTMGHDVAVAHDAAEALKVADDYRPDTAILDIGLPAMDGYELGRCLRESGFGPRLMIALTGYGQDQDRDRSMQAGFDAHLVKPISLARLVGLLESQ